MNEQANIQIVQQAFAYFTQGNVEGILSTLASDVEWTLPEMQNVPYGGKRHGVAGAGEFFAGLAASEDVTLFAPQQFVAQGDHVAVFGQYACKVKATGNDLALEFAHIFTVRDGKIVSFKEYTDTAATVAAHTKA